VKVIAIGVFAACLVGAQSPKIGDIEFYGLRKITAERIAQALKLKVGDPLPPSRGDLEEHLEELPGVVRARVEAACCVDGNAILFIGIEEKGAPHFAFRSEPSGQAVLTPDIVENYSKFMDSLQAAVRRGKIAEDLTRGHGLMADPDTRALQERFLEYARAHLSLLREVLRSCTEPDHRAIAAAVIGYAPGKKAVIDDLQLAMQDPDEAVRANAMRALNAIGVLATRQPELGLRISPTWFIEMLNSIVLSDRIRSATALVTLTEKDASALDQVRERSLDAILEMARWKALDYALPAFILAGRMAGLDQKAIEDAWTKGAREPVLAKLREGGRKK